MSNSLWKCQKSSVLPISVGPDASAIGAGAVLLQKDADRKRKRKPCFVSSIFCSISECMWGLALCPLWRTLTITRSHSCREYTTSALCGGRWSCRTKTLRSATKRVLKMYWLMQRPVHKVFIYLLSVYVTLFSFMPTGLVTGRGCYVAFYCVRASDVNSNVPSLPFHSRPWLPLLSCRLPIGAMGSCSSAASQNAACNCANRVQPIMEQHTI